MTYVVVTGSVVTGFKFIGPFDSVDDAVAWADAEPRKYLLGPVTVVEVESVEEQK